MQQLELELELHQPCANYHCKKRLLVQPSLLKISWSWWVATIIDKRARGAAMDAYK
jgi:hypothetical protein